MSSNDGHRYVHVEEGRQKTLDQRYANAMVALPTTCGRT